MPRSLRPVLAAAAAVTAAGCVLGVPAGAQTQPAAAPGTVTAVGSATVRPSPADRNSNASIAAAVGRARHEAIPRAIGDARARAQLLADASHLTLGRLVGIADVAPSPFGPFNYGETGTFGPGRYCGNVPRFRTKHLAGGRIRRVRVGSHRVCRIPQVVATESVTFATA